MKGVLQAFTLNNLACCSCSEDEKVEELAADDGDVEVVVGGVKMEYLGEGYG